MVHILRITIFIVAMLAAATVGSAQTDDSPGRLRFGAFWQGLMMSADETRPAAASGQIDGHGIGATFGYDWSMRNGWIIGVEADGAAFDASDTFNGSKYTVDYMATFRARLGFEIHRDWLIYGTAGGALNGIHYRNTTLAGNALKTSATLHGGTVGLGAEWRFYDTVLFGEYLYASFQPWDFRDNLGVDRTLDTEAHSFRIGAKWIYGHDYYVDDVRTRH